MRRLIAYIIMALSIILTVGVAFVPTFERMNPGREFKSGREIVFQLVDRDNETNEITDEKAAQNVADEMSDRLDDMDLEDYTVKVLGNDMVSVTFATEDEFSFNYVAKYLNFDGGNFSLVDKNEDTLLSHEELFNEKEAYIVHDDNVIPYVIIPVDNYEKVDTMIESLGGTPSTGKTEAKRSEDHNGEGEGEGVEADIFLMANFSQDEGDTLENAANSLVIKDKIIAKMSSTAVWYEDSDEDVHELKISYASYSGEDTNADLKKANLFCKYVCNMFNASKFDYKVKNLYVDETVQNEFVSDLGVTYNYVETAASGENLLNVNKIRMGTTLIATLVCVAVISLLLIAFHRLLAIGAIANTLGTVFLTFALFLAMNASLNFAAIIGGIVLAIASVFVEMVSMQKFKEEVYKGRSFKKANQEAGKRTNVVTLDVAVILAFAGLMFYVLGGVSLKPLGIILFFGGLITIPMNLIIYKIMNFLLCNTTLIQDKPQLFNLEEKYVSNGSFEQKEVYVAPDENKDFTKKAKPLAAIGILLSALSVAAVIAFAVINGSPLNVKNSAKTVSTVYTEIYVDLDELQTKNISLYEKNILDKVESNGAKLTYSEENVNLVTRKEYDLDEKRENVYTCYSVTLNYQLSDTEKATIEENMRTLLEGAEAYIGNPDEAISIKIRDFSEKADNPKQGFVALATGITIVGAALYLCFRYRPSRGIAALIVSTLSTAVAYGVAIGFSYLWPTTAITSLLMPIVALVSLFATLIYFAKEKELFLDSKEEKTKEVRKAITIKALGLASTPILAFLVIVAYFAINYFGFGLSNLSFMFLGTLVGVIIVGIGTLTLVGPLANKFANAFGNIKLPERKAKVDKHVVAKKNSSEPEETIFIGIND